MEISTTVRVVNPSREPYIGKVGLVAKQDTRDGRSYVGVLFVGVRHVVWFYESELEPHV